MLTRENQTKNTFICQTLKPHNFTNTQPNQVTQSSKYSWQGDLFNVYHGFGKWEIRYLAKFGEQSWFCCFFVCLAWNSYFKTLLMMNGEGALTCNNLEWPHTWTVMDGRWRKTVMQRLLQMENDVANQFKMMLGWCFWQGKAWSFGSLWQILINGQEWVFLEWERTNASFAV
jgi:hypothetical protein